MPLKSLRPGHTICMCAPDSMPAIATLLWNSFLFFHLSISPHNFPSIVVQKIAFLELSEVGKSPDPFNGCLKGSGYETRCNDQFNVHVGLMDVKDSR